MDFSRADKAHKIKGALAPARKFNQDSSCNKGTISAVPQDRIFKHGRPRTYASE
jgi:hypothetical protein